MAARRSCQCKHARACLAARERSCNARTHALKARCCKGFRVTPIARTRQAPFSRAMSTHARTRGSARPLAPVHGVGAVATQHHALVVALSGGAAVTKAVTRGVAAVGHRAPDVAIDEGQRRGALHRDAATAWKCATNRQPRRAFPDSEERLVGLDSQQAPTSRESGARRDAMPTKARDADRQRDSAVRHGAARGSTQAHVTKQRHIHFTTPISYLTRLRALVTRGCATELITTRSAPTTPC